MCYFKVIQYLPAYPTISIPISISIFPQWFSSQTYTMADSPTLPIQHISIIGCGSIGASWAALFLAQGMTVTAFDINAAAEPTLRKLVTNALPVLKSLGMQKTPSASADSINFTTDLPTALKHADFVQENGPERLELKQKMFNEMAGLVRPDVIIATSSSGLTCSSIQAGMAPSSHPERVVVGHPFNPPHLMPLVEVVPHPGTNAATIATAIEFYDSLGRKAIHIQQEAPGFVANRLQAALLTEAYSLVSRGVISAEDLGKFGSRQQHHQQSHTPPRSVAINHQPTNNNFHSQTPA